jgi:hypothetical protein
MTRLILTSHSIDNTFDYCARKFEFLNLFEKRPARESGYAADVGTALHEGTQAWLVAREEGKSESEATDIGYMKMLRFFPWQLEALQKTSVRSYDKVMLALYRIIRHPCWDDWELLHVDGKGWAVEVPWLIKHTGLGEFTIKNTGERVLLGTQGKIDFILRNKSNPDKIVTTDLKTTTTPSDMLDAEYEFSGQQIGYSQILYSMLGAVPRQMEYNYLICRFSSDEEPEIRLLPIEKDADEVEDYWLAKLDRLHRIKAMAEMGWFPRTNGGCHSWGQQCRFFDICHSRDYSLIRRWFEADESMEDQQGYDYWVELEV